ncbi:hypothetical protein ACI79J_19975 [Geodermatophilus sp. SYSU D01062]
MSFLSRLTGGDREVPALPYDPASAEGLAARWVQWVASIDSDRDPIEDATGEHAGVNQPGDVFFLAGSYGKVVHRRCVVPGGRDLFLPLFNIWTRKAEGPPLRLPDAWGALQVDGADVEPVEIGTPVPFSVTGALLNPVTLRRKPVPVVVWGWWARVPAPAPGSHVLRAVGGDGHGFTVDVTWSLEVAPVGAIHGA